MIKAKTFLSYFVILILAGLFPILFLEKGTIVLYLNREFYDSTIAIFFKYITFLGDGILIGVLFIGAILYKYRYAIIVAISALAQLILVHINKQILFHGLPRPKAFFNELGTKLQMIEGVKVHSYNTFPSGHTATAFSIFFILSIMIERKGLTFFFFLLAVLVGTSRIYLLQHFFIDAYFGAIIGVVSVLVALFIDNKLFAEKEKLNNGLLNR